MKCTLIIDTDEIGEVNVIFESVGLSLHIGQLGDEALVEQTVQVITLCGNEKKLSYFIDRIGPVGTTKTIMLNGDGWMWHGQVQVLPDAYSGLHLLRNTRLLISASKPSRLII